ncbi:uracil-DNA glycosylase family protein [Maribacter hydrothermalis]|uniref:Uracil-DNA glycosylase n=1 Tax=Maribacter hydrothermalis TaxID=1836467 RepID=A0A1B7Z457_9FLAO|nr:uracil-DNA glycosylase family protein [Maribacter hydrothermalis]APQ17234.1 uracil-DNA glycosylase [Maribacter hydrothermalis]OBR37493.1 uracil-DNA glycosylase [Maribacter hydrothermalis]
MQDLLSDIRGCEVCREYLPLEPRPIVSGTNNSKIILVSQAPGRKAHVENRAWDDHSGKKLREWLGVNEEVFYNPDNFAVLPMGFCYPGKGKSGDLPPRKECAPLWHPRVWEEFKNVKLILLIGTYAQDQYLGKQAKKNLTENVLHYQEFLPKFFVLPHPSPVNRFWRSKNPWFEEDVVGELQELVAKILG